MNAPVTRRVLLGATAALGAVALPAGMGSALAVPAEVADPDAVLLDLITRHAEAEDAWQAACRVLEVARNSASAAYPPCPAALTATPYDLVHGLEPSGRSNKPGGRAWIFFNLNDIKRLRVAGPVTSLLLDDTGKSLVAVPNPTGEARRREVVEVYDRWLADRTDVDRHHGLTAAEAAEDPLCASMEEAEAAVASYVPVTLSGLRAKAVWVLARYDRAEAAVAFLRQIAGDAASAEVEQDTDDLEAGA